MQLPRIFDAHFHIFNPGFLLQENQGFLPKPFSVPDYLERMAAYDLCGGAVVSASFQGFDQEYLIHALQTLGPSFVGVTQLPASAPDSEFLRLNQLGIRALRFNIKRGGSAGIGELERMARRAHECAGWHAEIYIDSALLADHLGMLKSLPQLCIDHLGLSREGLPTLLKLAEAGTRVKASGFGRVDFDVRSALRDLTLANPECLLFGTDLPSTRAPIPFSHSDFTLVAEATDSAQAQRIFFENAVKLYQPGCREMVFSRTSEKK